MMCDKHPSYASKRSARMACRKMGNTFRTYWCNDHHGWHVTKEREKR